MVSECYTILITVVFNFFTISFILPHEFFHCLEKVNKGTLEDEKQDNIDIDQKESIDVDK